MITVANIKTEPITVVIGTYKYQKGDWSNHRVFNPNLHKVYDSIEEWKNSSDYPRPLISVISPDEVAQCEGFKSHQEMMEVYDQCY